MAKTRQATPQSREEKLRKKREAERRRYQRMKEDPIGREQLRQKEITQYLKKKEKNVIRPINDLSERSQRKKRKQWRECSQAYRNRKKELRVQNENLIRRLHEDTPPISDQEEDHAIVPVIPNSSRRISANKRYARNRKRRSRECKQKNEQIRNLKRKIQKYKQKYYRLKKKSQDRGPASPNKRVEQIMCKNETVIAKKVLFAEVLSEQLKTNYKNLSTMREKQIFRKALSGQIVKKYRVKQPIRSILRGSKISETTDKSILHYSRKPNRGLYEKKKQFGNF